jgi:Phosphotransferase system, mannose/fructose/N-acetylgalactosamine-specific component IIB
MPIVLVRIDDRLVHGQVVEGWLKTIHVSHIVVVSDEVAKDKMQQTLLGMAVPSSIKVTNLSVEDAAKQLKARQFEKERIMLLLSRPRDVLRLVEQGVALTSVNVGGMHYSLGKRQLLRNLSVDPGDISDLQAISRFGIELEGRVLPADERVDIIAVINKDQGAP